mmetsp:Transcript_4617/g.8430  ORF Transcript_4617/g.8430 Transcript_4617/m.8430 type:complete len:80 (-) Transcript_4617:42-281(-)
MDWRVSKTKQPNSRSCDELNWLSCQITEAPYLSFSKACLRHSHQRAIFELLGGSQFPSCIETLKDRAGLSFKPEFYAEL